MAARKVPSKYTRGLGGSTQDRRRAEIRKRATGKKESYKPLPGDSKAKTKPSQYTKRIRQSGLVKDRKMNDSLKLPRVLLIYPVGLFNRYLIVVWPRGLLGIDRAQRKHNGHVPVYTRF